jgi:hypothetical protein
MVTSEFAIHDFELAKSTIRHGGSDSDATRPANEAFKRHGVDLPLNFVEEALRTLSAG